MRELIYYPGMNLPIKSITAFALFPLHTECYKRRQGLDGVSPSVSRPLASVGSDPLAISTVFEHPSVLGTFPQSIIILLLRMAIPLELQPFLNRGLSSLGAKAILGPTCLLVDTIDL